MRILCQTLFDCTYTGITGTFRSNQLPLTDRSGNIITTQSEWNFARNQQRNWETIMQMISLRAQPTIIKYPVEDNCRWEFIFEVETAAVYSATGDADNYDTLLNECNGIPMVINLGENPGVGSQLVSQGTLQNIWFESVNN